MHVCRGRKLQRHLRAAHGCGNRQFHVSCIHDHLPLLSPRKWSPLAWQPVRIGAAELWDRPGTGSGAGPLHWAKCHVSHKPAPCARHKSCHKSCIQAPYRTTHHKAATGTQHAPSSTCQPRGGAAMQWANVPWPQAMAWPLCSPHDAELEAHHMQPYLPTLQPPSPQHIHRQQILHMASECMHTYRITDPTTGRVVATDS
jgi:hypothetical protein